MKTRLVVSVAILLITGWTLLDGQTNAPPLRGAWRVSNVVVTGAGALTRTNPQPGILLFTGQHYSIVLVAAEAPRTLLTALKDQAKPTPAELAERYAHWNPVTGQSGTIT